MTIFVIAWNAPAEITEIGHAFQLKLTNEKPSLFVLPLRWEGADASRCRRSLAKSARTAVALPSRVYPGKDSRPTTCTLLTPYFQCLCYSGRKNW
jgi:hypothetical protein